MKQLAKAIILSTALFATIAGPVTEAVARDYHHGYYRPRYHHHGGGNAVAAGVIGLATGAIIGSALSQTSQPPRVIYHTPAPIYYPPAPGAHRVYRGGLEPWSPGWYNYCSRKFRSFNPRTGTFRGYDGRNHFCDAS